MPLGDKWHLSFQGLDDLLMIWRHYENCIIVIALVVPTAVG